MTIHNPDSYVWASFPGWHYHPASDLAAESRANLYREAWEEVAHLYPAHLRREHDYVTTIWLDPEIAGPLTPLQRAVLAYGGPIPYGATVTGFRVRLGSID